MSVAADPAEVPRKKSLKLPMMIGVALAILGGGGGFYLVRSGILGSGAAQEPHAVEPDDHALPPLAALSYVAIDPLLVNLPRATGRQFLRFTAALEVPQDHAAEVESLRPRITDVMNGFLRAVEPADFEDQMILAELRSQLLRRIQVVTGEGRVNDLLIIEFVLN